MKYTYINFGMLRNNDFDIFNNHVIDASECITLEDSAPLLNSYRSNIGKFREYVGNAALNRAKTLAKNTDKARLDAFVNFRNAVRNLCKFPIATDAALAKELWQYVKQGTYVHSMTQDALTEVIQETIKGTEACFENEDYAKACTSNGLKILLDDLKEKEAAYEFADLDRAKSRANRSKKDNETCRKDCIKDYENLVCFAYSMVAVKSDAGCMKFLDRVENIVKEARSRYIRR